MPPKVNEDAILDELRDEVSDLSEDIKYTREVGTEARKNPSDTVRVGKFKARISRLDDTFQKLLDKLTKLKTLTTSEDEKKMCIKIRAESRSYYYEALSIFDSTTAPAMNESASSTDLAAINASIRSTRPSFKLPTINLPTFEGELAKWPTFKDTFQALIHSNGDLSTIQKYHYLRSALKGAALQAIAIIPLTDLEYPQAWAALLRKYDNIRLQAATHLSNIFNYKPMVKTTLKEIQNLTEVVLESVTAFQQLHLEHDGEFILVSYILRLLTPQLREKFESSLANPEQIPELKNLWDFVHRQNLMFQAEECALMTSDATIKPAQEIKRVMQAQEAPQYQPKCPYCQQIHLLYHCSRFLQQKAIDRYSFVQTQKICYNCLSATHQTRTCRSKNVCRTCSRKHHTLLHLENHQLQKPDNPVVTTSNLPQQPGPTEPLPPKDDEQQKPQQSLLSTTTPGRMRVMLGTAQAHIQSQSGEWQTMRMVIDSGAQRSFITTDLAGRLGLIQYHNPQTFCGFGNSPINGGNTQVTCNLSSTDHMNGLVTDAVVIDQICSCVPSCELDEAVVAQFAHLKLADKAFGQPGPIDFLLGADLFPHALVSAESSVRGTPSAVSTIFGWVIMGRLPKGGVNKPDRALLALSAGAQDLPNVLERFWQLEEVTTTVKIDPLDTYCEEHFQKTHQRDSSGRYIVRLPFHTPPPEFINARSNAINRFYRLESKLNKDIKLKAEYSKILQTHIDSSYVSLAETAGNYFLPHHGVVKEESTSTRLRIVFDASAATPSGSLNDVLCTGPKLQNEIRDVLLAFRLHPYAIVADISQMYLQILVHPQDRTFQHFWYRFNSDDALQEYELNRVTFGVSCSPFLAIRVLHQLIHDEGAIYPQASQVLKEDIYIDDVLTSTRELKDALHLQKDLIELLEKAGFILKKWSSNHPALLQNVPDGRIGSVSLADMEDSVIKVLGLEWDPTQDGLAYRVQSRPLTFTKRGIMSTIARLYDPLGYLAPVVFQAKTLLQCLWKLGLDWDEAIPEIIKIKWAAFFEELPDLRNLTIPRCLFPDTPQYIDLIGFADASSEGYAAVVYLRIIDPSGLVRTPLILARTKLAPLNMQNIPRLELCAALLLVRTLEALERFLSRIKIRNTHLFLDSTTVLDWIHMPTYRLKTFVANRIAIIQDLPLKQLWYHVPTTENAADVASRGCSPSSIVAMKSWWQGPQWLALPIDLWPVQRWERVQATSTLPEIKPEVVMITQEIANPILDLIEKQSSYTKLIRIVAYCRRFVHNSQSAAQKSKITSKTNHNQPQLLEIRHATHAVIQAVQKQYFSDETAFGKLKQLAPFYDHLGIIRVGGRLINAPLNQEAQQPILLPNKSRLVTLLVEYYHITHAHAGPQLLLFLIRQRFWIISARQIIRKVVHQCLRCHQLRVQGYTPFMSDLPASRYAQGRAFIHTGVDFAGPFPIRESKRRKAALGKAYLALYICMSTKAVHCEVVSQLSTEAFFTSFDRFIARRGVPARMFSDNGTNFVGAQRSLQELQEWWNSQETKNSLTDHLSRREIHWSFNPPCAPHFGGLWEAGIKSFKSHLTRILDEQHLTFEELMTISSRIEAILNSRPLYPISSDPDNYDVLTPGHFLIGAPLCARLEWDVADLPGSRLSRWEFLQKCTQHFWSKWKLHYLNHLQQRSKWTHPKPNIEVGTMVLLKDENAPPLEWARGRVIECHPGHDGITRVVTIQTTKGRYTRPLTKLAPLFPEPLA